MIEMNFSVYLLTSKQLMSLLIFHISKTIINEENKVLKMLKSLVMAY